MSNSKNIAKNTIFLFIRMLLTMGVTLYTSRVVLNTLGIEDYGIYNIVGGVVALFSVFNSAMTTATQRYLSFEIGIGNDIKLQRVFNSTLNIHIGISLLFVIFCETIGLWFVNNKLNIAGNRMDAVNYIYQFSILTFVVGIIRVPFNSLIIARERMNIFAIYSILEVVLKLLIIYLLVHSTFDKLITYAFLIFLVTFLISLLYQYYCIRKFKESKYQFYYNKELYKELLTYSGWNLFGNVAMIGRSQGVNIILNIFLGAVVNAAYAISIQIQSAVQMLVNNFQTAVNPQIIKYYAQQEYKKMHILICQSSKVSFFLLLIIISPVIYHLEFIINLWLINPPIYTITFAKISLINLLIDCLSGPLMTGVQATGKIKWYQIFVGTLLFLNVPISYVALAIDNNPVNVFYISVFISIISLLFRLFFLKKILSFDIIKFLELVTLPIAKVLVLHAFVLYTFNIFDYPKIIFNNWVSILLQIITIVLIIYIFGINKDEKKYLKKFVKK